MELTLPIKVELTNTVMDLCQKLPTCEYESGEKCPFWVKHEGCFFRGKTPREWDKIGEVWEEIENK